MSRTLTKVLLKRDFGLEWDMPDSHLVPGLTGRINYINWIQEVLNLVPHPGGCSGKMEGVSADATAEERTHPDEVPVNGVSADTTTDKEALTSVEGLDVGTGASCIYPLLGHSLYSWKFIATDIDPESVESARKIVVMNHLEDSIQILQRTPEQPLLKGVVKEGMAFCMCNPPFFSSIDEVSLRRRSED